MMAYSVVSCGIRLKFKGILALRHVLNVCKNEEDPINMKALECPQQFSHYKSMGDISRRSRAATCNSAVRGWIWSDF